MNRTQESAFTKDDNKEKTMYKPRLLGEGRMGMGRNNISPSGLPDQEHVFTHKMQRWDNNDKGNTPSGQKVTPQVCTL